MTFIFMLSHMDRVIFIVLFVSIRFLGLLYIHGSYLCL
jgi:hypothetical protein